MPIKGLRIGAFGWTGTRGEMSSTYHYLEEYFDANNDKKTRLKNQSLTVQSARKNRYAFSAEYSKDEYMFRTEYLHSQGWGSNLNFGDKADGWYVFGIVPVIKSKLHAKARYQCYRQDKSWNRHELIDSDGKSFVYGGAKTSYEVGLNYFFTQESRDCT